MTQRRSIHLIDSTGNPLLRPQKMTLSLVHILLPTTTHSVSVYIFSVLSLFRTFALGRLGGELMVVARGTHSTNGFNTSRRIMTINNNNNLQQVLIS